MAESAILQRELDALREQLERRRKQHSTLESELEELRQQSTAAELKYKAEIRELEVANSALLWNDNKLKREISDLENSFATSRAIEVSDRRPPAESPAPKRRRIAADVATDLAEPAIVPPRPFLVSPTPVPPSTGSAALYSSLTSMLMLVRRCY